MHRIVGSFILSIALLFAQDSVAQSKTAAAKPKKVFLPQAYLGKSDYKGGPIKKDVLASLLKQGITTRDSDGNFYKVVGFEFVYGERMLYEDSVGNLMVDIDYLSEYCTGDTLSTGISNSIYDRLKVGDSAFFNKIDVLRTVPGKPAMVVSGMGMKFYITK